MDYDFFATANILFVIDSNSWMQSMISSHAATSLTKITKRLMVVHGTDRLFHEPYLESVSHCDDESNYDTVKQTPLPKRTIHYRAVQQ